MPRPRPKRPKSDADVHYKGRKTDRRQRMRNTATSAFSPGDGTVTGLIAWYDFSLISTLWKDTSLTDPVTADADVIKGVTDRSGTGNHLTEPTNGPAYKVNIQNGKSIARFDGSNDELSVAGITAPVAGWTCFGVFVKAGAITAATDTALCLSSSTIAQLFTDGDDHASGMNWYETESATVTANVATGPTSWGTKVVRANSTASLHVFTAGGTPVDLNPSDGILVGMTMIGLAHNESDSSNYGDYDFGEVLMYNVALSATNMNLVGNYLATKWNVTWSAVS